MSEQAHRTVTIDVLVSEEETEKAERLNEILIEGKTLADELTSKRAGVATINDKDKTKRRKTLF